MSSCRWVQFACASLKIYTELTWKSKQEQGKPQGTFWQFDLEMKLHLMKYHRSIIIIIIIIIINNNNKRSFYSAKWD